MAKVETRPLRKKDLLSHVEDAVRVGLLPGDCRTLKNGYLVWSYRTSWGLSTLKANGEVRNPSRALWEITEAGLARLHREEPGWNLSAYQGNSRAHVRVPGSDVPSEDDEEDEGDGADPKELKPTWDHLLEDLPSELAQALEDRLRPDLGPTPGGDYRGVVRNLILYGPPGTGKTYIASRVARALTGQHEPRPEGRFRLVQFHPSYSYEDFVQGLKPDLEHTSLRYKLDMGPLMKVCQDAEEQPDRFYVLVIDEINRGDPARIFGELLYALEYRGQPVELPLGGTLRIPMNLVVLGTMNSVDRSVALVDYALRRRFGFLRMEPDPGVVERLGHPDRARVLSRFNSWLTKRLDREHALGHSFFLAPDQHKSPMKALERIWRLDIRPLLEEYFFGDSEALAEAEQKWKSAVSDTEPALEEGPTD